MRGTGREARDETVMCVRYKAEETLMQEHSMNAQTCEAQGRERIKTSSMKDHQRAE